MPGKLYDGRALTAAKNGVKNNSKAFCEGMAYRQGGTGVQRPITDVSLWHQAGSEAAAAWEAGWTIANDAAGGNISKADLGPCNVGTAVQT